MRISWLDIGVAQVDQGRPERLVGDLEIPAAGELLELHEREVGFDTGGVAIHQQADRAGRRDDGRLGIAIAVPFAQGEGAVPAFARGIEQGGAGQRIGVAELLAIDADRQDVELFVVAQRLRRRRVLHVVRSSAMIAHHPEHVGPVVVVTGESPQLAAISALVA